MTYSSKNGAVMYIYTFILCSRNIDRENFHEYQLFKYLMEKFHQYLSPCTSILLQIANTNFDGLNFDWLNHQNIELSHVKILHCNIMAFKECLFMFC